MKKVGGRPRPINLTFIASPDSVPWPRKWGLASSLLMKYRCSSGAAKKDGTRVIIWPGQRREPGSIFTGLSIEDTTTDVLVSDNLVEGTSIGLAVSDSATLTAGSGDNCFQGNGTALSHSGDQPIDLSNNYWGDASGPSGMGSGTGEPIAQTGAGAVTFSPWLTLPPPSCQLPVFTDDFESGDFSTWSVNRL